MARKPIKVIGCGGIGTWLLDPLCMFLNFDSPKTEITLIDGDVFEEKNRRRQKFSNGGNKAQAKAAELLELYPDLYISAEPDYITSNNVVRHLRNDDTVFLCVDNHATRKLVGGRCEELDNVVLISGGNELHDGNVQVHIREQKKNLTLPIVNKHHPEIINPDDHNPGEAHFGCGALVAATPQLVFMNNAIATMMCNAYYAYTNGVFHGKLAKMALGKLAGPQKYDETCTDILVGAVTLKKFSS
jgi:molybdopterin/thiamine biosynthesis adenylyltransferase